jgi:hypothetical protein
MTDAQDLQLRWARHSAAIAKANSLNKAVVFDALSAGGITEVCVGFDGEGDSGQIESVTAHAQDKAVDFPATMVTYAEPGDDEPAVHETTLRNAIEQLCYDYLEQEHGGWENNDGAFGEFIFDVAKRRITLDFNGRFTDYAHHSHTF